MRQALDYLKYILNVDFKKWIFSQICLSLGNVVFLITTSALVALVFIFFEKNDLKILLYAAIIFLVGLIISSLLRYNSTRCVKIISNKSMMNFREKLLTAAINQKKGNNNVLVYFNEDINNITNFLNTNITDIMMSVVVGVVSIIIMTITNIWFSAIMIICIAASILNQISYFKKLDNVNENIRGAKSGVYNEIKTNITGQEIMRSYNKTNFFIQRFSDVIKIKKKADIDDYNYFYKYYKLEGILENSATIIPFVIMFIFTYFGFISLPIGIFLLQISGNMMFFINKFVPAMTQYSKMKVSYLKVTSYIKENKNFELVKQLEKYDSVNILIDKLCVHHNNFAQCAINVESLELFNKKITLIIGPSGSGKTTLIRSILNLIDYSGNITLNQDNKDVIPFNQITSVSSYMPQLTTLFKTTIMNNITCGQNIYDESYIIELSKQIGAHDFISKRENGYNTLIGEENDNFSGGEIQKILLLRALLKDSSIIFLDEPSANLDIASTEKLIDVLLAQKKEKNVVLISHDFDFLKYADIIVYVDDGKILYNGSTKTKDEMIKILCEQYDKNVHKYTYER